MTCRILLFTILLQAPVTAFHSVAQCPDDLVVNNEADLHDFRSQYPDCDDIRGNVTIAGTALSNIDGLNTIERIRGDLTIRDNSSLADLDGLSGLERVDGSLVLKDNFLLSSTGGLSALRRVGDLLEISGLPFVTDLSGFSGLSVVRGSLLIEKMDLLSDLNGLQQLEEVVLDCSLINNPALSSLEGLSAIVLIEGALVISGNDNLLTLRGISDSLVIRGGLTISGNKALSVCEVEAVCNYLDDPPAAVSIEGNDAGCRSETEVIQACHPLSVHAADSYIEKVFPNPGNGLVSVLPGSDIQRIDVVDLSGRIVKTVLLSGNANLTDLPVGVYYLRIYRNGGLKVISYLKGG